jgi:DNA-binding LytR/AlgR family response regulator
MLDDFITIENETKIKRLSKGQITYISVESGITTFYTDNGESFSKAMSLKNAITLLSGYFVRVNRNCAINKHKVKEIDKRNRAVTLTDKSVHIISVRNYNPTLHALNLRKATLSQ